MLVDQWTKTGVTSLIPSIDPDTPPENDDQLDAIVGWVLGTLLVKGYPAVAIVGDATTGSFLLPVDDFLLSKFRDFQVQQVIEEGRRAQKQGRSSGCPCL